MLPTSSIPAELVQAYTQTEFRVLEGPPFALCIGQRSAELLAAHQHHRVDSSAVLTACNPLSQLLSADANAQRQDALAHALAVQGHRSLNVMGQHPSNQWPGEPSFLVFGLQRQDAIAWGQQFEQNAVVWTGPDGVPQLICLR